MPPSGRQNRQGGRRTTLPRGNVAAPRVCAFGALAAGAAAPPRPEPRAAVPTALSELAGAQKRSPVPRLAERVTPPGLRPHCPGRAQLATGAASERASVPGCRAAGVAV